MRVLKKMALLLLVLVAGILGYAATKPDSFQIRRSATIPAPPEKVFALVNDFHHWRAWSPWEGLDPKMQRTYSGAASGEGAVYAWEGNKKAGAGSMRIVESTPPSKVGIQLDFLKPFPSSNSITFSLEPRGGGTFVTWDMTGPANYMTKVMTVFFDMDRMVGKDFEAGLANLQKAAQS